MTELPRLLIAKIVPDVFRDEPRNIGVILWTPDAAAARFLGENPEVPGVVIDAEIPAFVNAPSVYKMWIRAWRRVLEKPAGLASHLATQSLSNFRLVEMGLLPSTQPPPPLEGMLERLFTDLVLPPPSEQVTRVSESGTATKLKRTKARPAGERRRLIDPTTCTRAYSDDETDFTAAMMRYKRENRRPLPTWGEVLEVLHSLGYRKGAASTVPTTGDRGFEDDTEFSAAMERHKRDNRRPFPTWAEVLAVFCSLGFSKMAEPATPPVHKTQGSGRKKLVPEVAPQTPPHQKRGTAPERKKFSS